MAAPSGGRPIQEFAQGQSSPYIARVKTTATATCVLACAVSLGRAAIGAEHVTVPAPLGQQNKEVVVEPGATLKQASCGRVLQGEPAVRAPRTTMTATNVWASGSPTAPSLAAGPSRSTTVSDPAGPPLVEAAYLTLRGTLGSFDKGLAVTIVDRNGRTRTIPLVLGARVDEGLKVGDLVAVRIPLEYDPANKAASRVERQKPAAPATSSKFAAAQSTLQ